jgi:hypothetical protein
MIKALNYFNWCYVFSSTSFHCSPQHHSLYTRITQPNQRNMTQKSRSLPSLPSLEPTVRRRLLGPPSTQWRISKNSNTSGRSPEYCRPQIFHTFASKVLENHKAITQFNVEPNTLPPSTNWQACSAEGLEARRKCDNAINALNTVLIRGQGVHGIPTGTDLNGNGDITKGEEPSKLYLQLCTVLSRDPTLNTKRKIIRWCKDDPEFALLRKMLKKGKWPEKDRV